MTEEEFGNIVSQDPALAGPIQRAARAVPSRSFGVGLGEAAAIAALFPLVRFVVSHIGLPWLHEVGRFSELWRLRFHDWIDGQYDKRGLDPDAVEAAGEALREELEGTSDPGARAAWERLAQLLGAGEKKDK